METVYAQRREPFALAELIDGCAPHRAEPQHGYVVRPGHFAHSSTTSRPANSSGRICRGRPVTTAAARPRRRPTCGGFLLEQSGDARDTALRRCRACGQAVLTATERKSTETGHGRRRSPRALPPRL